MTTTSATKHPRWCGWEYPGHVNDPKPPAGAVFVVEITTGDGCPRAFCKSGCMHADIGAYVRGQVRRTVEPERCACEESLALCAQLQEAAANVGELLALIAGDLRDPFAWSKLDAARNWLKAYLANQPAR